MWLYIFVLMIVVLSSCRKARYDETDNMSDYADGGKTCTSQTRDYSEHQMFQNSSEAWYIVWSYCMVSFWFRSGYLFGVISL